MDYTDAYLHYAPFGASPTDQIERRIAAIEETHALYVAAFPKRAGVKAGC